MNIYKSKDSKITYGLSNNTLDSTNILMRRTLYKVHPNGNRATRRKESV